VLGLGSSGSEEEGEFGVLERLLDEFWLGATVGVDVDELMLEVEFDGALRFEAVSSVDNRFLAKLRNALSIVLKVGAELGFVLAEYDSSMFESELGAEFRSRPENELRKALGVAVEVPVHPSVGTEVGLPGSVSGCSMSTATIELVVELAATVGFGLRKELSGGLGSILGFALDTELGSELGAGDSVGNEVEDSVSV